jgi:SAM-dependent methyltransferase
MTDADECCRAPTDARIARHFDHKMRERTAAGALPPLHEVSAGLLAQLADVGEAAPSILEIGCGSAALTMALLELGAQRASGVDLSPGSIDAARRRAAEANLSGRTSFRVGDGAFVELEAHDWVVLDRVICCYRDMSALLGNAIPAAQRRFAFSVPDSRGVFGWMNRVEELIEGVVNTLRGRPCPGYVHDIGLIEGRLAQAGFRPLRTANVGRWYVGVFERTDV